MSRKNFSNDNRSLISSYIIIFSACFMLFVYEPILMYATNMNDFWFDFRIMIIPTLEIFGIFFISGLTIYTIIYFTNKILSKKLFFFKAVMLTGALIFFVLYVQGNWLTKDLPPLDGSTIEWSNYGKNENIIIVLITIVIASLIVFGSKMHPFDKVINFIAALSMAIVVMLFISLLSVIISNDSFEDKDNVVLTMDNFNNISEHKNFLIFLVDAVDSGAFNDLICANPKYKEVFNDFTYYSDMASVYPYTRESVPLILTGNTFKNEEKFSDYSNYAYNNSQLFSMLSEHAGGGYGINLYEQDLIWKRSGKYNICNTNLNVKQDRINLVAYAESELKYVLFKYLPYFLKRYSHIHTMRFESCRENTNLTWDNPYIYMNIIDNPQLNKQKENMFQFIHAEGAHAPYNYDRNLNIVENGTYEQKIESSITMINAYIQRLKDNDSYDNSIIIIMADHGAPPYHGDTLSTEELLKRFNPVFLVKGFHENHEFIESDIPVSHLDLISAYSDLLTGKKGTDLFETIEYGRIRTFNCYDYGLENYMVEYETDGNMRDTEKFRKTGKIYHR